MFSGVNTYVENFGKLLSSVRQKGEKRVLLGFLQRAEEVLLLLVLSFWG